MIIFTILLTVLLLATIVVGIIAVLGGAPILFVIGDILVCVLIFKAITKLVKLIKSGKQKVTSALRSTKTKKIKS